MATDDENCGGAQIDDGGQDAAQILEFCEFQGQGDGHHGEEQDTKTRSEVTAVDGDEKDSDEEEPTSPRVPMVEVPNAG